MLVDLYIRNFAIIDELELRFAPGMCVFSGETGAGKSILVDALGLVLGLRADADVIRPGANRAEVCATFSIPRDPQLQTILGNQSLDSDDDDLLLRRIVSREGRSRAFVNGTPVAVGVLRQVTECLLDIHGQHAHQSLLRRDMQMQLLDAFGHYDRELLAVKGAFEDWRDIRRELETVSAGEGDHDARIALLEYQVRELTDARLADNEVRELEQELRVLANASQLRDGAGHSLHDLYEADGAVFSRIGGSIRRLGELATDDDRLHKVVGLLQDSSIHLQEAIDELRDYLDQVEANPQRLQSVETRLEQLHELGRKHHIQPEQLAGHLRKLSATLQELQANRSRALELESNLAASLATYGEAAKQLRTARKKAAKSLAEAITGQLRQLGMDKAAFEVRMDTRTTQAPAPAGDDVVEYFVSLNPGQPVQALSKVASGGELSRISLAIQVIGNRDRGIPTLIFDEVDAGIGGATAEIVGRLLHTLAQHRQVICVTHLPQVAAQGDHHYQVEKSQARASTRTRVVKLDAAGRVEEIARMLGGVKISERTRDHAREMLNVQGAA